MDLTVFAIRHAVRLGTAKRNCCLEELDLNAFMVFVHTMYRMLGIVTINQGSGTLSKVRKE